MTVDKKTDSNGEIVLTSIDEGIYMVQEITAHEGYQLNSRLYHITEEKGKDTELVIANTPKPSLTINKVDAITKDGLKGAKIHILYASNNTFTGDINDMGSFQTDENGQVKLCLL